LQDALAPSGHREALFSQANIPNHGVLGRAGAAGYLRRVATELMARNLKSDSVAAAAVRMQASSDLFRELRYQNDLSAAGALLAQIANLELQALRLMEEGWPAVREIGNIAAAPPNSQVAA
jgi:hypothetical protein